MTWLADVTRRLQAYRFRTDRAPTGGLLPALSVALVLALIGSGALVWQRTAAQSSTVVNGPNSWTLGAVTLTDDAKGSAMFAADGLLPGSTGVKCLSVSYAGTVAATVKLYAGAASDPAGVAQYLGLTIEQGTGGGFGSCRGFVPAATVYAGTLADFITKNTDFVTGVGRWTSPGAGRQTYRIRYTLDPSTPNNRQAAITQASFQWQAQA